MPTSGGSGQHAIPKLIRAMPATPATGMLRRRGQSVAASPGLVPTSSSKGVAAGERATREHPWHIPLRPCMLDSDESGEDSRAKNMHVFGSFSSDLLRASLLNSSRPARTSLKASYSQRPLALSVPSSPPTSDRLSAGMDLIREPVSSVPSWVRYSSS